MCETLKIKVNLCFWCKAQLCIRWCQRHKKINETPFVKGLPAVKLVLRRGTSTLAIDGYNREKNHRNIVNNIDGNHIKQNAHHLLLAPIGFKRTSERFGTCVMYWITLVPNFRLLLGHQHRILEKCLGKGIKGPLLFKRPQGKEVWRLEDTMINSYGRPCHLYISIEFWIRI